MTKRDERRKNSKKRTPKARTSRPNQAITKFDIKLTTVILWVLVGVAFVIGLQPWLSLGEIAVGYIEIVPFYDLVINIPVLNGGFLFLEQVANSTAVSIVGISIAAAINVIQVHGGTGVSARRWVIRAVVSVLEFAVGVYHHAPYAGGIEAIVADFPFLDPYYLNVEGALMTIVSVFFFETLWLYGFDYIRDMEKEYRSNKLDKSSTEDSNEQTQQA